MPVVDDDDGAILVPGRADDGVGLDHPGGQAAGPLAVAVAIALAVAVARDPAEVAGGEGGDREEENQRTDEHGPGSKQGPFRRDATAAAGFRRVARRSVGPSGGTRGTGAPSHGVPEDPATGSAAAAFAGLLAPSLPDGSRAITIEQGYEMGRPSTIALTMEAERGRLAAVRIGGHAVRVAEGRIEV